MTHRATAWLSRGQLNLTCDQTSKSGHSLEPGCRVERHLPRARVRRVRASSCGHRVDASADSFKQIFVLLFANGAIAGACWRRFHAPHGMRAVL